MLQSLVPLAATITDMGLAAQCCYTLLCKQPCRAASLHALQKEQQVQVSQARVCHDRLQAHAARQSAALGITQVKNQNNLTAICGADATHRQQSHLQQGRQHGCALQAAVLSNTQSGSHFSSWRQHCFEKKRDTLRAPARSAAFSSVACGLVHHPPATSAAPLQEQQPQAASTLAHPCITQLPQQLQQQHPVARVLDGKAVAAEWSAELEREVPAITRLLGRPPGLAVILVGDRPDSMLYVSKKEEACQRVGINCRIIHLQETVRQHDLQDAVAAVAVDAEIDGVLVQLPLPRHMDEESVMGFLDPKKDVDGFHPLNMGRMLMRGRARRFVPATPLGVVELLSRSGVNLAGKTAVVVGDSNIVGTPLAALLRDEGVALVTTCHRPSIQDWFEEQAAGHVQRAQADLCLPRLPGPGPGPTVSAKQTTTSSRRSDSSSSSGFQALHRGSQLPAICRTADILVVAVGSAELVRGDWVKPGAVVVDVGINVVPVAEHPTAAVRLAQQQHLDDTSFACTRRQQGQNHHSSFQLAQGSMSQAEPALQQQHEQHGCCQPGTEAATAGSGGALTSMCGGASYTVVGDVAAHEVAGVAAVLTPVPGGVGPMTIAAVLHNTLQAARYRAGALPW